MNNKAFNFILRAHTVGLTPAHIETKQQQQSAEVIKLHFMVFELFLKFNIGIVAMKRPNLAMC